MNEKWFSSPFQPSAHEWPVEEVEKVATRLIESAPKGVDPWQWAAEHAIRYLDKRRDACLAAVAKSNQVFAEQSKLKTDLAERNESAQIAVPFKKAVCRIVGNTRWERALPLFKKYLRKRPMMFELYITVAGTGDGGFIIPERSKENLDAYVQNYLEAHSKSEMTEEEIARLKGSFLEVKREIFLETQKANAKKKT